jgi:hypothetical protein
MSTYIYLECLDHDPPLRADGESGQHLCDLHETRRMIANRDEITTLMEQDMSLTWDSHFASNTAWFLYRHPKCQIGIVDEYGKRHPYQVAAPKP